MPDFRGDKYFENDVDENVRGIVIMAEGTGNVMKPAQITSDGKIKVDSSVSVSTTLVDIQQVSIIQAGTSNNVKVVNASGGDAVNIQDGGNSITVDGSLTISPVPVQIVAILNEGTSNNVDANITNAVLPVSYSSGTFIIGDGGGSITVDGSLSVNAPPVQIVAILQTGTSNDVDANITNSSITVDDGGGSLTVDGSLSVTLPPVQIIAIHQEGTSNQVAQAGSWVTNPSGTAVVAISQSGTNNDVDANITNASIPVTYLSGTFIIGDGGGSITVDGISVSSPPVQIVAILNEGTSNNVDANITNANVPVSYLSGTFIIGDGGGSITVDGISVSSPPVQIVAILNEGTSNDVDANITNASIPVSYSTGTFVIGDGGGSITIDGSISVSAPPVQIVAILQEGTSNDVDANITNSSLPVTQSGTWTLTPTGTQIVSILQTGTSNDINASGDIAHDSPDSGNPLKTGGIAIDYQPDSEDEQGQTEVAANDRTNQAYNLRGENIEGVNSKYHLFNGDFPGTGLDGVYDDNPTSSISEPVEAWNYRYATVGMKIESTSAPTDIQIIVQASYDNITYFDLKNGALGQWIYDDTYVVTPGVNVAYSFDIAIGWMKVKVVCTGTDSTSPFTVSNSFVHLRN